MSFPNKYLKQKAVYWAKTGIDGFHKTTYGTPVEINCRWEYGNKLVVDDLGKERNSKATVFVDRDMNNDDGIYFGTLDSLSASEKADPTLINEFEVIKQYKKIPSVSAKKFLRVVWL